MQKPVFGASTRFDTNRTVQRQKIARCINIGLRLRFMYTKHVAEIVELQYIYLAFIASSFRVTEDNLLLETDLFGTPSFLLMFSLLLKELMFIFFVVTAAGFFMCGGPKGSPVQHP